MNDFSNLSTLVSKKDAARNLAISLRHLDNLLAARALECVRIGRSVRFSPEALARFRASHTAKAIE